MTRHRRRSIEVVIQRSAVYGIATALIIALYAVAVIASEMFLRKIIGYTSLFFTALAVLAIAVAYQPLVRVFQNLTERLFFRGRYDYQKVLRKISRELAAIIKLDQLTKLVVSTFIDAMRVAEISFLLPEKSGEVFRSAPLAARRYKIIEVNKRSRLMTKLAESKNILVQDEIKDADLGGEIERLGFPLWVPVVSHHELIGVIALGGKLSGEAFTSEDLGLLYTLASQIAVALDNARLYEEVMAMEEKIQRADKLTALATMAAGMAHEIKNPLSSMKVFAQLLPKKIDEPEYRKKLSEILPREIDRIDRIVEGLLDFAKSTAPTFTKVKIEAIIEENAKYFTDQLKTAGVKLKKSYASLPEVEIDKAQISQVFSNLILNAIQAMPEGGEISISTLAGKKIEHRLQTIKIQISDTGHGIAPERLNKLFDPFFTTKYGGTGLGLTITHSIVDGHKGFIDVASKIGRGTTFTVTLPVSQSIM